jgi:hypothetical protein
VNTQGHLLLAILMHTSLSSSAFAFGQTYATLEEELLWTAISVAVAWIGALVVWVGLRRPDATPIRKGGAVPAE